MASIAQLPVLIFFHKLPLANVRSTKRIHDFDFVICDQKKKIIFFLSLHFNVDHFTAKLSVRTMDGPDLVSTSFTFFDCSTHLSCTQCVSSQFPCDWCVEAHRCTHDTAENCRNDILVTGVSVSITKKKL